VPHDFSGVGGEHQPDVEVLQQGFQLRRWHIQAPQALEQVTEGGRLRLAGEGRGKGIHPLRFGGLLAAAHAGQIAVFLDPLLEDVHQLEIEREGPGRGDGLHQIHFTDQLHHRITAAAVAVASQGFAELLHPQQAFRLLGRTFAAEHRFPEILHQLQTQLEELVVAIGTP
jgi:hypothetical protein